MPPVLVGLAAGLGASQGSRIARSGVGTDSVIVLGAAVLLVLSTAAFARWQRRSKGSD